MANIKITELTAIDAGDISDADVLPIDDADGGPAVTYKITIGTLRTAVISPSSNGAESCGTSSLRWANVYGQAANITGTLTQAIGSIANSTPALTSTATWNAGGTTFTHIFANITNTASAAASRVVKLQVGGSDIWSLTTGGAVTQAGGLTITAGNAEMRGSVICGTAGGLVTTATDGFVYFAVMGGVPTGVPTGFSGRTAMTYDTANNKLYVYNGGWKSVTLA